MLDFLRERREAATALLAALVRIPADNPPGDCAPVAEQVAGLLEQLGLVVERHPVPEAVVRLAGMASCTNLVVRRHFGDGPVLALAAHGDVVPPGDGWSADPYGAEIRSGWLYGRGAAVSKSDIATYVFALLALDSAPGMLHGAAELHVTFDEEVGGEIGPKYLLAQGIVRPDAVIGAGFSHAVVTAHNGALHLEVTVQGRSAHAARPSAGVDALEAATHILSELYRSRAALTTRVSGFAGIGAPQLTVGLIAGGTSTNVVPDRVSFRLDRRIVPEERPEAIEHELRTLIDDAAARFPVARVSVSRLLLAAPLTPLPGVARLAGMLCRHASAVFEEPVEEAGAPLYTDARHYAAAGIPVALYGAGPRSIEDANAHRADERVALADLHRATEVVALAVAEFLAAA